MKEKKTARILWHEFSDEELKQKALDLSATLAEFDEVEEKKADAAKMFGDRLKDLRGMIRKVSTAISKRGEDGPVECLVMFHRPTVAAKEVFRCDTGEKIAEEAMTPSECQEHLFDAPSELYPTNDERKGASGTADEGERKGEAVMNGGSKYAESTPETAEGPRVAEKDLQAGAGNE